MARFLAVVQTLERVPVPTIAAVHALNLTIGFEFCLGCDLMWAAENASSGLVEATVGLNPAAAERSGLSPGPAWPGPRSW